MQSIDWEKMGVLREEVKEFFYTSVEVLAYEDGFTLLLGEIQSLILDEGPDAVEEALRVLLQALYVGVDSSLAESNYEKIIQSLSDISANLLADAGGQHLAFPQGPERVLRASLTDETLASVSDIDELILFLIYGMVSLRALLTLPEREAEGLLRENIEALIPFKSDSVLFGDLTRSAQARLTIVFALMGFTNIPITFAGEEKDPAAQASQ